MDFFVTIIIPTKNRSLSLADTLNSIAKQRDHSNIEVIVIDNGSTDDTKNVCLSYDNQITNLTYIYDDEPGLLTGRHHGSLVAKGEVFCFLDDDVELNPLYVQQLCTLFKSNPNIKLATGPCLPKYEQYPPKWLTYFWQQLSYGKSCPWLSLLDLGSEERFIDPNLVWGLNFVIRKEVLLELGGFHPDLVPSTMQEFQGDGETGLTLKVIEKDYLALYHPGLQLYHQVSAERLTPLYFKKRAYYQGVSDSFTSLRKTCFDQTPKNRSLRDKLHPYYRWIKHLYPQKKKTIFPQEILDLQFAIQQSYQDGFDFHQQQYATNEKVKDWVNRQNYWNYKLPEL